MDLRHHGVSWCTHYIDDFLTIGNPNSMECMTNLEVILETCERLRGPLKLEGPSMILTFLGITLDTVCMEIQPPEEKLEALKVLTRAWWDKWACRKLKSLSLTGKLSHACKVVQEVQIFLR